jgi:hypothetical protein
LIAVLLCKQTKLKIAKSLIRRQHKLSADGTENKLSLAI